jgi:uncharacterized membrane protein YfhO
MKQGVKTVKRNPQEGKNTFSQKGKAVVSKQIKIEDSPFEILLKKHPFLVYSLAAILIIFIVFHKFLFLTDTYLFTDIGSDSVNQIWPFRYHLSEYLHTTGLPKWSFNEGVGKNIYPISIFPFSIGDPFNIALCLFPKEAIPYCTAFFEVLKMYLGGLFFFLFLRTLKFSAFTTIIGGLLYAFCGYMVIGSSYVFSTETLYAALLLFCTEKYLRDGSWYLIPIPFFLFASLQPFLLYMYGMLATIYCIARIAGDEGWQWKKTTLTILKIGALAFAGVIMCSFNFISNIDMLLHIPRSFGGEASSFSSMISTPIFSTSSLLEFTTTLYRFFSSDMLGTGDTYIGWSYYIESPIIYTGLITCLLMPLSFTLMEKRKRMVYLSLTILAFIPSIFPFFRHAFWIFSGEYYRTYSIFISLLFLVLGMRGLSSIDLREKINMRVLLIILAVLLIILFYPFYSAPVILNSYTGQSGPRTVNTTLRIASAVFLVIYTCIINFYNNPAYRRIVIPVLGLAILTEVSWFTYISVNTRPVISNTELHEKKGYNDYTVDAMAYINAQDKGFFRVDKTYGSSPSLFWKAPYNDALIQDYKGTSSYDSFNQNSYCDFLNILNVYSVYGLNYLKIIPSQTRPLLSIILNGKYVLVKQPYPRIPFGYFDSLTTIGDVSVTRNKFYLPFGYTFQNYISLTEFMKLNNFQKDKMLFRAFIAVETEIPYLNGLNQLYAKDTIPGTGFDVNEFKKYTDVLRKDSLSNLVYTQNTVKGNINMSEKKLLFLTVPYDKGWQFKVDGAITMPVMPDVGFMGVMLDKGEHTIELNYEPPYAKLGWYISAFSILGYIFLVVSFRKRRF